MITIVYNKITLRTWDLGIYFIVSHALSNFRSVWTLCRSGCRISEFPRPLNPSKPGRENTVHLSPLIDFQKIPSTAIAPAFRQTLSYTSTSQVRT